MAEKEAEKEAPRLERRVVLVEPEVAPVRPTASEKEVARREKLGDVGPHATILAAFAAVPSYEEGREVAALFPPVAEAIAEGAQNIHTVNALNKLLEARNLAVSAAVYDAPAAKVVITPDGSEVKDKE
jgi:hypothetical protein